MTKLETLQICHASLLLFSSSSHSLYSVQFSAHHFIYCVFSAMKTTRTPKIALPDSRLFRRDKGSWKGVEEVKVSPHQSGRFCQRVACSHSSASAAPPNDCTVTTLYQSNTVLVTPQGTQSTSEGKRQTD